MKTIQEWTLANTNPAPSVSTFQTHRVATKSAPTAATPARPTGAWQASFATRMAASAKVLLMPNIEANRPKTAQEKA